MSDFLTTDWQERLQRLDAINNQSDGDLYIDPMIVDLKGDKGASETLARIYRNQWTDWKNRFQPRLEQLAGYAATGELTEQSIGLAQDSIESSFENSAATLGRNNQRLGIQMTSAQKKAADRTASIGEATAKTTAMNNARISGQDRDMQILAGGAGLTSNLQEGLQQ